MRADSAMGVRVGNAAEKCGVHSQEYSPEMTIRNTIREGAARLQAGGIEDAALDARLLMLQTLDTDTAGLLFRQNDAIGAEQLRIYNRLLERRAGHEPLQYIAGFTEFMGLHFEVNESVLIPRQDTETLCERVLAETAGRSGLRLLDMCTGSGCIAIALAKLGAERFSYVCAADISERAVKTAVKNAALNQVNIDFYISDLFSGLPAVSDSKSCTKATEDAGAAFDIIVSNPPYIRTGDIEGLEPEVRAHEPVGALDGGEDGLVFYRRIAASAGHFLKPGGRLFLEIGYDEAEAVSEILSSVGYNDIRTEADPGGNDRVVYAVHP